MDTFSTYNKKLAGYKDVSETVKVIEKIAATQLRSLEKETYSLSAYTKHVFTLLSRIHQLNYLTEDKGHSAPLTNKSLLIVITGDKGLVGDLWQRIFSTYEEDNKQDVIVIGKKGKQQWPEFEGKVTHYSFANRIPTDTELQSLAELLNVYVNTGVYRLVSTLHLHPSSIVDQRPTLGQLLPIDIQNAEFDLIDTTLSGYPIVEGSLQSLQKSLYKKYLLSRLRQIILETAVSEYSARAIAMEHAVTKTDEAKKRLHMLYSRDKRKEETQKQLERFATKHTVI